MEKLREVADRMLEMLNFTCDHPEKHSSGWMPVLDTQIRSKDNQLQFLYFEKPCTNDFVIGQRSAMAQQAKRTTLIQDGLRRMLNTMPGLEPKFWQQVMEDFATKLMRSGYSSRDRYQVIHGALSAYACRVRQDKEGVRDLYRSREYQRIEREEAKLRKKETWFQAGGGGEKVKNESVLFVTATPNSQLANNISERLKKAEVPVKVAEMSGTQLGQLLVKTNPHQDKECDREDCFPC